VKLPSWFTFLIRSTVIGVIISTVILMLVPDLRKGSGLPLQLFDSAALVPEKLSFYQAVSKAAPAVVNIYSTSIDNRGNFFRSQAVERTSLGSGVIMSADGYLLTCLHVIQKADSILVGLTDGRWVEGQIVGQDPVTDLAVLKIMADNLNVVPQLENPDTRVGDLVLAIGNPYNLGQTITQGVVSRTGRSDLANYVDFIQMDAVLNEGNSGGALIDSNGYLIGINNSNFKTLDSRRRVKDVNGVFFSVPYKLAKRVMDEIIANGKVTRGQLGIAASEYIGRPGITVTAVAADSPAANAGVMVGDLLLSIDGIPIVGGTQTLELIAETAPGTELVLEISRNDEILKIKATVAELGHVD
jgi:serine protease DegS